MRISLKIIVLLIVFSSSFQAKAQQDKPCPDCSDYDLYLTQGKLFLQDSIYDKALTEFQAAQIAASVCGCSTSIASSYIKSTFNGIKKQKERLEMALHLAELKTKEAFIAKRLSDSLNILTNETLSNTIKLKDSISQFNTYLINAKTKEDSLIRLQKIELQNRELADSLRDMANQKNTELIIINDLEALAKKNIAENNIPNAILKYEEAIQRIENLNFKDTFFVRKRVLLSDGYTKLNDFQQIIKTGDQYLASNNYLEAYEEFNKGMHYPFAKELTISKIKNIETAFENNYNHISSLSYKPFREAHLVSAKINNQFNKYLIAQKRIARVIQYQHFEHDFINTPNLKEYAVSHDKNFFRSLKLNINFQGEFGSQSMKTPLNIKNENNSITFDESVVPKWNFIALGLSFDLNRRIEVGFDLSFAQNYLDIIGLELDANNLNPLLVNNEGKGKSDQFKITNYRIWGAYTFFNTNFRKGGIKKSSLSIAGIFGIENFIHEPRVWIALSKPGLPFDPPHGRINSEFPPKINGFRFSTQLWNDYSMLVLGTRDLYTAEAYDPYNTNIFGGIKLNWKPFKKLPKLNIIAELSKKFSLTYKHSDEVDQASLLTFINNGFNNAGSSAEISNYLNAHFSQFWEDEIEIQISRKQFLYSWSMRTGLSYDF